jgi:hypothetical protein
MNEQEASKFPCESARKAQEEKVTLQERNKEQPAIYRLWMNYFLSASGTSFPKQSCFQTLALLASSGSSRCLSRPFGVILPSGSQLSSIGNHFVVVGSVDRDEHKGDRWILETYASLYP